MVRSCNTPPNVFKYHLTGYGTRGQKMRKIKESIGETHQGGTTRSSSGKEGAGMLCRCF